MDDNDVHQDQPHFAREYFVVFAINLDQVSDELHLCCSHSELLWRITNLRLKKSVNITYVFYACIEKNLIHVIPVIIHSTTHVDLYIELRRNIP